MLRQLACWLPRIWRVTAVCLIAFILIVAVTRYVSLGSLVVVTLFLIGMVFFGSHGAYGLAKPVSDGILSGFGGSNADGILETPLEYWPSVHGTENKIGSKKK